MSLIDDDGDSWLTEFSSLERLTQQIQNQISERDQKSSVAGDFVLLIFLSL
jgi:hypothetical protein